MRRDKIEVDKLPIYWQFKRAILGNFALTAGNERYMIREFVIENEGERETPSYHFSKLLDGKQFPKKLDNVSQLAYPYKAIPCRLPEAVYLDIRSAFYTIASVFGLENMHREGRYLYLGASKPHSLFAESKLMRALLVAGVREKSTLQEWTHGEIRTRQFPNKNYAPNLSRSIFAFLHSVHSALYRYTVYCHTDGFIIPVWYLHRVSKWLDERQIPYSIKGSGPCQVYGVGSYSIGKEHTKSYHSGHRQKDNIRHEFSDWWLKQWDKSIEIRGKINGT
jgi:hypothetical protein